MCLKDCSCIGWGVGAPVVDNFVQKPAPASVVQRLRKERSLKMYTPKAHAFVRPSDAVTRGEAGHARAHHPHLPKDIR